MLPNFLIVGAAKAGTTSLCHYLSQHPQIFISPIKEPRFFTPEFYTTHCNGLLRDRARKVPFSTEEYHQLFSEVKAEIAIGESSTEYLYFPSAPVRIRDAIPQVKIIAILRNPIERAFSAFCYQSRDGCEPLSFKQALLEEKARLEMRWRPGWLYVNCGFYYEQLKRYFDNFEAEKIKIFLYEDLDVSSVKVVQDICEFLGVNSNFEPDLSRRNISKVPRIHLLNTLFVRENPVKTALKGLIPEGGQRDILRKLKQLNFSEKPVLPKEIYHELVEVYKEDILRLEDLIERDLSHWL